MDLDDGDTITETAVLEELVRYEPKAVDTADFLEAAGEVREQVEDSTSDESDKPHAVPPPPPFGGAGVPQVIEDDVVVQLSQ